MFISTYVFIKTNNLQFTTKGQKTKTLFDTVALHLLEPSWVTLGVLGLPFLFIDHFFYVCRFGSRHTFHFSKRTTPKNRDSIWHRGEILFGTFKSKFLKGILWPTVWRKSLSNVRMVHLEGLDVSSAVIIYLVSVSSDI